jgi:aminoglycoside 3-N-acetyltransferase
MLTHAELKSGLRKLGLKDSPVIAHASLKAFGEVDGDAQTLIDVLLDATKALIMPTHTYKAMITPREGPEDNGIRYDKAQDLNLMAEFYTPSMRADPMMGVVPETLRQHPNAKRSAHPILSFAGIGADKMLAEQTLAEPLAPIRLLAEKNGWVLLLGVDHTVSTSMHYAEKLAGRRQFIRWALTENGVVECPGFPGCSAGFQAIERELEGVVRQVTIGDARVQAVYLPVLLSTVAARIKKDARSLLCHQMDCERCNQIRKTPVSSL